MSDIFCLDLLRLLISYYCPSLKLIGKVLEKLCQFLFSWFSTILPTNFRARELKYSSFCNCTEIVENDIAYDGQQFKNVTDVSPMEKCKDLCTSQSGCAVFTYKTTGKMCTLLKSKLKHLTISGYVSGTPACYGYR